METIHQAVHLRVFRAVVAAPHIQLQVHPLIQVEVQVRAADLVVVEVVLQIILVEVEEDNF